MKALPATLWASRARKPTCPPVGRVLYRPQLERLEDRLPPATHIWTGADAGKFGFLWSVAGNWTGGVPTTGEVGGTIVQFNGGYSSIDNIVGLVIDQLHFAGDENSIAGFGRATLGINQYGASQMNGIVNDTGNNIVQASLPMSLVASGGEVNGVGVQVIAGQVTLAGAINGNAGLTLEQRSASGVLQLSGPSANTYTGQTFVFEGTLLLNKDAGQAATAGDFVVGSAIASAGPALLQLLQDGQIGPAINLSINAKGTLDLHGHSDTIAELSMHGGTVTTGAGTLTLNNGLFVNSGSGEHALIVGNLALGGDVVDGTSSGFSTEIAGTLDLGAMTRTVNVRVKGQTLYIDSVVRGAVGSGLTKTGPGELIFEATGDNSYGGATTVEDGSLILFAADPSGGTRLAVPGDLFIGSANGPAGGALVLLTMANQINSKSVVQIQNAARLDLNGLAQTIAQLNLLGTSFAYRQATATNGTSAGYTFTIDGAATSTNMIQPVGKVVVTGTGAQNTATLVTNDTYKTADNQTHETAEAVTIGYGAKVQKLDANGKPSDFMSLTNFQTIFVIAGPADQGFINSTPGVKNVFVGAGGYSYMNTGNQAEDFYYLKGAGFVYGYASGPGDFAYQYDGSGASFYTVSGTAYSFMVGTDGGAAFQNYAVGFKFNEGIANHPSQDVAYFFDSKGNDNFTGFSQYSSMTSTDDSFAENDIAAFFNVVYAYSFVGGTDTASVFDANVNHVFGFMRLM